MSANTTETMDVSLLTPEEIAAINAEASPDELVVMRQHREAQALDDDEADVGEGDDEEGEELDGSANTAASGDDGGSGQSAVVGDDTAQAATNTDQPGDNPGNFQPRYQAALPEDFSTQVDAIKADTQALAQQFREGEIDFDEFQVKSQELQDKRDALSALKLKAEIAQEMSAQTAEQEWYNTVRQFAAQVAKSDGIDYGKDLDKRGDFDTFIKMLAAKPEHNDKPQVWFLQEAHKRVKALYGLAAGDEVTGKDTSKPKPRKPPVDALPATLAHVAGGDGSGDVGDSEFDAIDKLDGLELEAAIARMSPERRRQYLAA